MSQIGTIELIFLLLLFFVVGFGLLARELAVRYPIVMVFQVSGLQPLHHSAPPRMDLPGRRTLMAYPNANWESQRRVAQGESDLCGWLDGHARCCLSRSGIGLARSAG
jgi:hypothetical protein